MDIEQNEPGSKNFQQKIYQDLDAKLRSTACNSGASEAHGVLSGLACRNLGKDEIGNKKYLFHMTSVDEFTVLQGMFELVLADLTSQNPVFNPLLPDDEAGNTERADEISNWCQGYLIGFFHDGESILTHLSESTSETINDVMTISNMQIDTVVDNDNEDEASLTEIVEFLRVGIQLVYDEIATQTDNEPDYSNHGEVH